MIVIADTTPLISLMKIGRLELLEILFGKVLIPEAVHQELVVNPLFEKETREINECEFIHVVSAIDERAVTLLRKATGLDSGESAAIVLTDEQQADLLLMDEVKGRNIARQMGIRIMGTIGILMIALEKGKMNYQEIAWSIDQLKDAGRHIKKELYDELMREAEKFR